MSISSRNHFSVVVTGTCVYGGKLLKKFSNTGYLVLKALVQVNNFGRVKEVLGSHRTRDDFSIMARRLAMGSGSEP